ETVASGFARKHLCDFSERHLQLSILKLDPDAQGGLPSRGGIQIGFVLQGEGTVNGEALRKYSAFSGREELALSSIGGMELLLVGLPIFPEQEPRTRLMAAEEELLLPRAIGHPLEQPWPFERWDLFPSKDAAVLGNTLAVGTSRRNVGIGIVVCTAKHDNAQCADRSERRPAAVMAHAVGAAPYRVVPAADGRFARAAGAGCT